MSVRLEVREVNEAGRAVATYVASREGGEDSSRVDVIRPKDAGTVWQNLLAVFLPAGYPHSVTEDYLWYQIYDSLQAFSSSIAGLLSSRAVLQGVGVGDATASPTAALLLSILQESMGRIATILFAHRLGTALEPECKMYRLAADCFNDSAMILDCLSPVFPKPIRVIVFSISSVLRALCGVAAGSSKASLSAHFAKWDNLGEVNAKDSSQETVISLAGMLAGSLVVSWVSSPVATWSTLILLLSIHLAMNHAAVRAVKLNTLNRQRAAIVISEFLSIGKVLSPHDVSVRERIFERDGALRWRGGSPIGRAIIGGSLQDLLRTLAEANPATSAIRDRSLLTKLVETFSGESYILWGNMRTHTMHIVLKDSASAADQLKAWAHALLTAHRLTHAPLPIGAGPDEVLSLLREVQMELASKWSSFPERMTSQGWQIGVACLETSPGLRIRLPSS